MHVLARQRGVTLIEVLMAVLIFSLGLIGLAGLLIMATRSNQGAYLRTQVAFLAHNMADRMSVNPMGVWNGDYNNLSYPTTATQACTATSGCTPLELANYDQQMWSSQLKTFLPSAKASIACTNPTTGFVPNTSQMAMRPPYGGNCVMTISWSEKVLVPASGSSSSTPPTQTFEWNFQP